MVAKPQFSYSFELICGLGGNISWERYQSVNSDRSEDVAVDLPFVSIDTKERKGQIDSEAN